MLAQLQDVLKGKIRSSIKLRALLEEALASLATAREEVEARERARPGLLLSEPDQAMEVYDRETAALRRTVDRLQAAVAEYEKRLAQSLEAEAATALDDRINNARRAAKRGRELLAEYLQHARAIAAVLTELESLAEEVRETCRAADAAGRHKDAEEIGRPWHEPGVPALYMRDCVHSLAPSSVVVLPGALGERSIWPDHYANYPAQDRGEPVGE